MIGLGHYLTVGSILFVIGVLGIFLNRRNVIIVLKSIEIMLFTINLNMVAFSYLLIDLKGQIFSMFILSFVNTQISEATLIAFFAISKSFLL